MANACPYNRQSSNLTINTTETLHIWVAQNPHLHMRTTSPYEGHTSHPSFLCLLHCTSRFLYNTSSLAKILVQVCLTPLVTLALWEHHMNDLDKRPNVDLHLATIQGVCMYVCCQFTTSMTCFHLKLSYALVVLNLRIPEIISICDSVMTSA